MKRAVYDRGIEVHPKYNKALQAEEAWKLIESAGRALGCGDSVVQEVSGYGDDNSDASNEQSGGAMEGVEMAIPKPDKTILGRYEAASSPMSKLAQFPKSRAVERQLDAINAKMREKNEKGEHEDVQRWCIEYKAIASRYQAVQPLFDRIQKDGNDKLAETEAKEIANALHAFLQDHHYPDTWGIQDKNLLARAVEETSNGRWQTKRRSEKSQGKLTRPDGEAAIGKDSGSLLLPKEWAPGLTRKNEKIFGKQPYQTTSRVTDEKTMSQCFFLVEKVDAEKGKGSMVFEDAALVGTQAVKAYLGLPEHEQVDIRTDRYCTREGWPVGTAEARRGVERGNISIRRGHDPTDKTSFVEIDDIAVKPGYSSRVYPAIAFKVKLVDGTFKYPNRSTFRKIWGPIKADRMIEDFYLDNNLDILWAKRAKRLGSSDVGEVTATGYDTDLIRNIEQIRQHRVLPKSPERMRRNSVSSSTSDLSDAALDRLAAMDQRMERLEEL
ncbi:hypothetical protein NX059_012243 [Plenodomus lindquistii]|nr:hypothetical protein NX059_012243 [Plenodomus lindquistii]